jgi:hypothetical protein
MELLGIDTSQFIGPQQNIDPSTGLEIRGDVQGLQGRLPGIQEEIDALDASLASQTEATKARNRRGGRDQLPTLSSADQARRDELVRQQSEVQGQISDIQGQQRVSDDLGVTGQPGGQSPGQAFGQPREPALLSEVNPLVSFLRDEGFEDIQESAAARGQLRSGGTLEDLTRFNTQLASTVAPQLQQQRFNQLFSVLGLGQNAAVGQGSAALSTASNIGNILQQQGTAQAQGELRQGEIQGNTVADLAGTFGRFQGRGDTFGNKQFGYGDIGDPFASSSDLGGF